MLVHRLIWLVRSTLDQILYRNCLERGGSKEGRKAKRHFFLRCGVEVIVLGLGGSIIYLYNNEITPPNKALIPNTVDPRSLVTSTKKPAINPKMENVKENPNPVMRPY